MKKNKTEKRLSIDVVTVRQLQSELTPEQLKAIAGGAVPTGNSGEASGSKQEVC